MTAQEHDKLPEEVKNILNSFDENEDMYQECEKVQKKLRSIGYDCDFDLGGNIFDVEKIDHEAKFFLVSGYWKDDGETFKGYLISVDSPEVDAEDIDDDTMTNGTKDVDIFYYGLDEKEIQTAIKQGKDWDQCDFVITSYKRA